MVLILDSAVVKESCNDLRVTGTDEEIEDMERLQLAQVAMGPTWYRFRTCNIKIFKAKIENSLIITQTAAFTLAVTTLHYNSIITRKESILNFAAESSEASRFLIKF